MKVLVIGKPTYNVILPLNNFLIEGSKNQINEKLEMSGGSSFYCAYLLAKWGIKVDYTGVVGSDIYGAKIKADLETAGVNIQFLETNYEHPTSFNYLLINNTNGSSTQIIKDNPEVNLVKYKYDFIPDIIIMDGTDLAGSLAAINNFPRATTIVLANVVSENVYSLAKKATYVVANINFAQALTKLPLEFNKPKLLVSFMQKIKDLNKADYTIMMREQGVLYSSERQVKMIPAINVERKIDDTHAGNIFFGAFCYGIINNLGMDNTVKIANVAAGLSLSKLGSLNSVPDLNQVLTMAGVELTKQNPQTSNSITTAVVTEETKPVNETTENQEINPEVQPATSIADQTTKAAFGVDSNQATAHSNSNIQNPVSEVQPVNTAQIPQTAIPSIPVNQNVNSQTPEGAQQTVPNNNQTTAGNIFD